MSRDLSTSVRASLAVMAACCAVLAGMGIGLLGTVQATSLPGLVHLDIEQTPPPVEVFLAFHRDAKKTPRIRVVAQEIESEGRRQIR